MERVVVTGMGVVSPIGNDVDTFWSALKAGKCGIDTIKSFDTSDLRVKVAAEVKNFQPEQYIDKREVRHMARFCQFAVAAAAQAYEQSGLEEGKFDSTRAGVIVGSGIGGLELTYLEMEKMMDKGPSRVSPYLIPEMIANIATAYITMRFGLHGESFCPVTACATSNHAIGEAMRAIRHGYQDVMLAGGSEAAIISLAIGGFQNMKALYQGDDPTCACIPFDKRRSGFVMGEGAGVLVLESLSHAKARGAKIFCEVGGYGATSDAYHITAPAPDGVAASNAMSRCIADAGMKPEDVDYINAHGTSTPINEAFETRAIKRAFGEHAYKVHISSTKSMTGHMLGGAAVAEAIACIKAIEEGIIPPTIGYKEPDPECDLDITPNKALEMPVNVAISNSLGFGGHNATVLLRKVQD